MRPINTISVAIILAAVLHVPVHGADDVDLTRFRKTTKQSTSTSCGAASAATWLQRLGLKTTEAQILASLADLWEAKRYLRAVILGTAEQANVRESIREAVKRLAKKDSDENQAVHRAVTALVHLQYPAEAIETMAESFLSGQHVPMGDHAGASRIDLEWAVNRTGIPEKASWRGLDAKKLVNLQHSIELSGVVLLPNDDHFVLLAGFHTDIDGVHAMISDPASETGGNLLVPVSHFITKADPRGSGVIWILTIGPTQHRPKTIFEAFESRPIYLSTAEWEQRAINSYVHVTMENSQPYVYMPITPTLEAFVGADQEMLLGIQGTLPIASSAIVSSIAHLRGEDSHGWRIGTQINDSSGNRLISFERRKVLRDSSVPVSLDSPLDNFQLKYKESITSVAFYGRISESPVSLAFVRTVTTVQPGALAQSQVIMRFGDHARANDWETTTTITRQDSGYQKHTVGVEIHLSRRW